MTTDKDSKRIMERMQRRTISIDGMWVDGKKGDRWLVRGNDLAADGATLKEALVKLADKIDRAVEAELLS
jgi:hypothetical protein